MQRLLATVGPESRQRLQAHLDGLSKLAAIIASPAAVSAGCGDPGQSTIDTAQANDQIAFKRVLDAHSTLIWTAVACDATRVIALQMGESGSRRLLSPTSVDEHGLSQAYADSQANRDKHHARQHPRGLGPQYL